MAEQDQAPEGATDSTQQPPENRLTITWNQISAEGAPLVDIVEYLRDQHLRLTQPIGVVREENGKLVSRLDFGYDPQQIAPTRLEGIMRGLEEIGQGNGLRVFDDFDDTRLAREKQLTTPQAKEAVLIARADLKREIVPGREWSQDAQHLEQFIKPVAQAQRPAAPALETAAPAPELATDASVQQPTTQPALAPATPSTEVTPSEARAAQVVSEAQAPGKQAPVAPAEAQSGVGELQIRWKQQGDQVAPLTEIRAYLDSLKDAGVAVGAMKLERGADGRLSGSFGVSYDPNAPDLAKLEGAVQGLKKVGNGLAVVEAPEQAVARRRGLGHDGQDQALDLAFPVREAFGIRQWDALSAQLSQAPKQALTAPEQLQQSAGVARVEQVAKSQGKTQEQVLQDGKSLLDVDTSGNPVSAFLKNFYEHLNGAPKTRQTLEVDYEKTRQELQARLVRQAGSTQVPAPAPAQGQAAPAATPAAAVTPAAPVPQPVAAPAPRFTKDDLPAEKLALFGLSADVLAERGQLNQLLSGQKTDLLAMRAIGQPGQEPVQFEGKLLLHREANGSVTLKLDLPRQQLEIPNEIGGQPFTPEQRRRLETEGTAGLVRGLRDEKGQEYNGYVGVDTEMKRLVILPEKAVTFKDEIAGVKLSPEQSHDLREGKAVHLAQLARPEGGKPFDGTAQIHAAKAGVEVRPEPYELIRQQAPQAAQTRDLDTAKQSVAAAQREEPKPAVPKQARRPRL